MYCIDGVRTLKNRKPTLKYSRKTGFKKNNAKAKTFGFDLVNSFKGLLASEGQSVAPAYAVC